MINLEKFFQVPFDDVKISDDKLKAFGQDHLQRITANNTGSKYDAMLSATAASYELFFGTITDEDTKAALKKARTKSVDDFIEVFQENVRRQEGAIRSAFGKDSPTYLEFFPNGLSEISNVTKTTLETPIARLASAATTHQAQLSPALVATFTGFVTTYASLRGEQLLKKGEVAEIKSHSSTARQAFELQLFRNLLTLALEFADKPDQECVSSTNPSSATKVLANQQNVFCYTLFLTWSSCQPDLIYLPIAGKTTPVLRWVDFVFLAFP